VGKGPGYWPVLPKRSRNVPMADPGHQFLTPKLAPGEMRPLEQFTNPTVNVIGHGDAIPYFVPALKETAYCDPRAAAGTKGNLLIDKFALWCGVFEADAPGSMHHGAHGAFCGVGEQPDMPYADQNGVSLLQMQIRDPEDAGRCPRCKGRAPARTQARVWADGFRGNG